MATIVLVLSLVSLSLCGAMRPVTEEGSDFNAADGTLLPDHWIYQMEPAMAFESFLEYEERPYKHNKASEEYQLRLSIFQSNLEKIKQHNAGGSSYTMALNRFADLSPEEFRAGFLGVNPAKGGVFRSRKPGMPFMYANVTDIPATVDWRTVGAVTPVKNQEQCGSCWAFSTTGSIESINFLKTGQLISLSEEELVDCDREHDLGCGGGLMDYAFEFVIQNGGLDTEEDYSYWSGAGVGPWCNKRREERTVVSIDSYEDVPENDEKALQKAVVNQPISVAICAEPLQFYSSGIVDQCCTDLDHGVLLVGYGKEKNTPYWLVKNSWGGSWGEEGYFRLKAFGKDKEGTCGIAMAASYPVKTSPNHPTIDVCGWFGWSTCGVGSTCSCRAALLSGFEYYTCYDWGCSQAAAA